MLSESNKGATCSGESWATCVGGRAEEISTGSFLLRMSTSLWGVTTLGWVEATFTCDALGLLFAPTTPAAG